MDNCILIVFGATGDLARRKLFPSIYKLLANKKFNNSIIVGAAHDEMKAEDMLDRAKEFVKDRDEKKWATLVQNTYYHKLGFENKDDFVALEQYVSSLEKKHNITGRRMVYLAAPSDFFCAITENCATSGLVKKMDGADKKTWHRMVY